VRKEETQEGLERDDISIFPLATPLLAGPGAISTVVLYAADSTTITRRLSLLAAIATVMLATYGILKIAPLMFRLLGKTGLNLLTRVMGIILTAVAVQFILNGIRGALVMMQILSN
jgi:multiple antibiotic resistance protein